MIIQGVLSFTLSEERVLYVAANQKPIYCYSDQSEAEVCVMIVLSALCQGRRQPLEPGPGSLAPHNEYKHHYCH